MGSNMLWTFGHSTRTEDETIALLREHSIGRVVDVRSIRGSRHNPWFAAAAMGRWLEQSEIEYCWIERLGGRRGKQPIDPNINAGWEHPSFRHYADYALSDDFAGGLAELMALATTPTAIMCAEAVPWRCHRSLIATVLVYRGWQVQHILGPGKVIAHEPGRWGAMPTRHADGRVTYPGQPALPGLAADAQ